MKTKVQNFFITRSLFRKEYHYFIFTLALSGLITIFFYWFLSSELIEEISKNKYVMAFSNLPAASFPEWIGEIDKNYWEKYSQAQFSTMPIHSLVGFIGSFFTPKDRFDEIKKTSWKRLLLANTCIFAVLVLLLVPPQIIAGYPIPIDYGSGQSILLPLTITWMFAATIFYAVGSGISTTFQIIKFKTIARKSLAPKDLNIDRK